MVARRSSVLGGLAVLEGVRVAERPQALEDVGARGPLLRGEDARAARGVLDARDRARRVWIRELLGARAAEHLLVDREPEQRKRRRREVGDVDLAAPGPRREGRAGRDPDPLARVVRERAAE